MAYAGTLTYKTELDTNGVKKSGGIVKGIIAGLGITKMISSAMNTIKDSTGDAIKRIDTFNQYPKILANFGVSADEASKSIKRIDESTRGLPIALDQAVGGVKNLFMVTKDLPKAEKLFKAMTDSAMVFAGGSSEAIDRFSYAFKQAMSAGKVSAQDFNQMNEAIPGLMDKVAESMGMTYKQLKEGLSDGSVSMDQFNNALIELDTKGGAGMKSLAETAKSATGGIETTIKNTRTAIVRGMADIIMKIDESLKEFGGLSGVISMFGQVATRVFGIVGNMLASVLPMLINLAKWVKDNKALVIALVAPVVSLVLAFKGLLGVANMLVGISKALKTFKEAMLFIKTIPTLLNSVKTAVAGLNLTFLSSPVFWIIAGIVALVAIFVILWNKCEAFRKFWINLWNKVMEILKPVIDAIKDAFENQIKPALENLMNAFQKLWTALQPIINFIITIVIAYIKMIIQQIQFLWSVLQPIITMIINILAVVINVVATVISTIINIIAGIISFIAGVVSKIIGFITAIINFIVQFGARLIQFVTVDIPNFINGVVQWFAELPGKIWNFISQIPGKIGQAIGNMVNTAKTKIPQVVSAIVNGLGKAVSKVADVGKNIMKGLWNGISGLKDWVVDKVKGMGKAIIKGLKNVLGIKSPSKVMRDEVGKWIPEGLAVGIDMSLGSIDKSLDDMYNEINKTMRLENSKLNIGVVSGDIYNKALYQTPVAIDLNADVEMDNQKVGRLVTPSVVKTIKTGGGSL